MALHLNLSTQNGNFKHVWLILMDREWNALHGGVYVPVTKDTQPNPYISIHLRELKTNEDTANRQIKLVDRNGLILKIYAHAYNNHNIKLYQNDKEFYIVRNNSGIYQVTVFDIITGRTVRTYTVRPTELDNWIR